MDVERPKKTIQTPLVRQIYYFGDKRAAPPPSESEAQLRVQREPAKLKSPKPENSTRKDRPLQYADDPMRPSQLQMEAIQKKVEKSIILDFDEATYEAVFPESYGAN